MRRRPIGPLPGRSARSVLGMPNGPHPEEAALLRGRLEGWTQALTRSILRDAVLRTAPQDDAGVWSRPQYVSSV